MPIIDVQRRYRELGRLRLGARRTTERGTTVPVRLSTWRMTSPARWLLEAAAELWGGEVEPWSDAPTEGEQWQLVTEATELPVYVPPQDVDGSQWYELWSGGGAQRRCDGVTEVISGRACLCDPDDRACSITTHLVVLLPQLPDVGVWRVRTTSWNAATELPPTVELLRRIHEQGALPIGTLGIESRTSVSNGQTRHFTLPVLRFPGTIAQAEREGITVLSRSPDRPQLPDGRPDLPDDTKFEEHRDETWGTPPDLPESPDMDPPPRDHAPDPASARPGVEQGAAGPADTGKVGDAQLPPAGEVWERYTRLRDDALTGMGSRELRELLMPLATAGKWGWPPREDWPADRLAALADRLEAALARGA